MRYFLGRQLGPVARGAIRAAASTPTRQGEAALARVIEIACGGERASVRAVPKARVAPAAERKPRTAASTIAISEKKKHAVPARVASKLDNNEAGVRRIESLRTVRLTRDQ